MYKMFVSRHARRMTLAHRRRFSSEHNSNPDWTTFARCCHHPFKLWGLLHFLRAFTSNNSFLKCDAGITYIQQNTLTGDLAVYSDPGIHFRVPFFSHLTSYRQVITASFGEGKFSRLFWIRMLITFAVLLFFLFFYILTYSHIQYFEQTKSLNLCM